MKKIVLVCAVSLVVGLLTMARQHYLNTNPYTDEELLAMYHRADTIMRRNDTLIIVNARQNSLIVETGIFTYLQYGYPLSTSYQPIRLTKEAMAAEKAGDSTAAKQKYEAVLNYFQNVWLKRKKRFPEDSFSDMNDLLEHNINVRLLASYAYEKLGNLPEASAVLTRYLANSEADHSKITQRYMELCIKQYGKAATKQELDSSSHTLSRSGKGQFEEGHWQITVFGAAVGVSTYNSNELYIKKFTPQEAQKIVRRQPFYTLVQ